MDCRIGRWNWEPGEVGSRPAVSCSDARVAAFYYGADAVRRGIILEEGEVRREDGRARAKDGGDVIRRGGCCR